MKRRALQIIVLLLLGAIVNVAVAWGLGSLIQFDIGSTWATQHPLAGGPVTIDPVSGERHGPAGLWLLQHKRAGAEHVKITATPWTMVDWTIVDEPKPRLSLDELWPRWGPLSRRLPREVFDELPVGHSLAYTARGWPLLSMWCAFEYGHGRPLGGIALVKSHMPGTFITTDHVFPLRLIWPGFAINTIFYAAILWVLFSVPLALRRRRRMRRGLCPACAYPVGTSPVCTECGKKIAQRRRD